VFTVRRAELGEGLGGCRWIEKDHLTASGIVPVSTIVRKASRVIAKTSKRVRAAAL
jgi:hypothetical protein